MIQPNITLYVVKTNHSLDKVKCHEHYALYWTLYSLQEIPDITEKIKYREKLYDKQRSIFHCVLKKRSKFNGLKILILQ